MDYTHGRSSNRFSSIKEAVKPLHPIGRRSTIVESNKERHRFSHLILEHGEKNIQDWAVIASSCSSDAGFSESTPITSNDNSRPVSDFQQSNTHYNISSSTKSNIPSACMGRIEGRLRLCSRSIVFEPSDTSRGIIRCPFYRMENAPRPDNNDYSKQRNKHQQSSRPNLSNISAPPMSNIAMDAESSDHYTKHKHVGNVAIIHTSRHLTMKANNIIGPFDLISTPVTFRFHFLHSSPDLFFELSNTLFQLVHDSQKETQTMETNTNKINQMLKPMLVRPFDPSNFFDVREKPLTSNLRCFLLAPLLINPGCALVTRERIYFQPANDIVSSVAAKAKHWSLQDIVGYARRYNGLKDSAIEFFLKNQSSVLLAFENKRDRESVIRLLPINQAPCHTDRDFVVQAMSEWIDGSISNFEYLLALNSAAGRTFHDLSRYPVFPWVIADYKSKKLDLTADSTFRDLSKPVGALDEERLEYFTNRLESMSEMEHPFLYGTHYSAPGYVLYYLVRSMPEHMLCLQNGKFDAPDRMFHDVEQCFSSVNKNHADVKELIPEFYDPNAGFDFLINARGLQLGTTQNGERVNDVILPPWARSGRDFIRKNRKALESNKCTEMLPHWIDLIFGYKSRGEEAKKASNLFHRMAYMGPADLKDMKTDEEKTQAELQATEFGIVPDMLFRDPHPPKGSNIGDEKYQLFNVDSSRALHESIGEEENHDDFSYKGFDNLKINVAGDQPWELLEATEDGNHIKNIEKKQGNDDPNTYAKNKLSFQENSIRFTSSSASPKKYSERVLTSSDHSALVSSDKFTSNAKGSSSRRGPSKASWDSITARNQCRNGNEKKMENQNKDLDGKESLISKSHVTSFGVKHEKKMTNGIKQYSNIENKSKKTLLHPDALTNKMNGEVEQIKSQETTKNLDCSSISHLSGSAPIQDSWDVKVIFSKMIHGDCVSGCSILIRDSITFIITVSLDGCLMVHKVLPENEVSNGPSQRRSFYGTKTTSFVGKSALPFRSNNNFTYPSSSKTSQDQQIISYRTHASTDPLACLDVTSDENDGHIVFAGGHNDVVVAYGINSACALASLYSHRDAVTGVNLIHRSAFGGHHGNRLSLSESSTHVMITGSWDATLKCWSVAIATDETVSINREPLAELYDADASIVCISSIEVLGSGVAICAGCADGSFLVWLFRLDGVIELVHKEKVKKGIGLCVATQWKQKSTDGKEFFLLTGFASGKVAIFIFSNGCIRPVSDISIGSSVKCLTLRDDIALVGCADGGLYMLTLNDSGFINATPRMLGKVDGNSTTGISCICADVKIGMHKHDMHCLVGREDGSIILYELKKMI